MNGGKKRANKFRRNKPYTAEPQNIHKCLEIMFVQSLSMQNIYVQTLDHFLTTTLLLEI